MNSLKRVFIFCIGCLFASFSLATPSPESALMELQHDWAVDNYQLSGKAQIEAFNLLLTKVDQYRDTFPKDPAILIWSGIIKSTYAGVTGGLGALKFAKKSKLDLEAALAIDPTALNGSAYTSLGTLYFKVPGWPLGFGNDETAEKLLKQALELNPDGIDPNYFYADFLLSKDNYAGAKQFLLKAQKATPRPNRELADEGRQKEIAAALQRVSKAMSKE